MFLLDHLSLVVSASERNKMSAQALATVMGPPLMLHSANSPSGSDVDHAQPIAVLKYLLQIWPQPQTASTISGNVTNSKHHICYLLCFCFFFAVACRKLIYNTIHNAVYAFSIRFGARRRWRPYRNLLSFLLLFNCNVCRIPNVSRCGC